MADEVVKTAVPPVTAPPEVTAAGAATPAPAPSVDAAPAPVPAPAEAPELAKPASEAAPDPLKPVEPAVTPHPVEIPSLLDKKDEKTAEPAKVEAKPGEKTAEPAKVEAKPGEEAPKVETAPAPQEIQWDFKLPETIQLDEKQLGSVKEMFSGLVKPKEGETPNHAAQRLVDYHNERMVEYANQLDDNNRKVFNNTRRDWQNKIKGDGMIGGAHFETAQGVIARMRDAFISDSRPGTDKYKADVSEFNEFLRITGAGDHPAFHKMLYRVGAKFDEPSIPHTGAKPSPNNGPQPKGRYERLYGSEQPKS